MLSVVIFMLPDNDSSRLLLIEVVYYALYSDLSLRLESITDYFNFKHII